MPVGAAEARRDGKGDDEGKHKPYQGRRQSNGAESPEYIVRIPPTGRSNPHRGDERGRLSRHLLYAAAWVVSVMLDELTNVSLEIVDPVLFIGHGPAQRPASRKRKRLVRGGTLGSALVAQMMRRCRDLVLKSKAKVAESPPNHRQRAPANPALPAMSHVLHPFRHIG